MKVAPDLPFLKKGISVPGFFLKSQGIYREHETVFLPQMFVPENGQSFYRLCARLRSHLHGFHYSIENRFGELGHFVSFNEVHVLYTMFYVVYLHLENIFDREASLTRS